MALTKTHNRMIANASANIRDFGTSVGTGGDDSAAFNAALSYLNSQGGGTLFIPAGTYDLNSQSTTMYDNIIIEGEGFGSILNNFTGGSYISINSMTWRNLKIIGYRYIWNTCTDLLFENIWFENYDPTGVSSGSSRFCQVINTKRVRLNNCYIKNCQYAFWCGDGFTGSNVIQNSNIVIENCTIENTEDYSYPAGVNIADGTEIVVRNNVIRDITPTGGTLSYGIYQGDNTIFKADRIILDGNIISGCGYSIKIHNASEMNIINNFCDGATTPHDAISNFGDLDPIDSSIPENCVIANNSVRGDIRWHGHYKNISITGNTVRNAERGISTYSSGGGEFIEYITIDGNTISNCGETGVQLQDTVFATVSNNTIINVNLDDNASAFQQAGISLYTDTNDIYVHDNVIVNQLATGLAKYGVFFHGTGTKGTARKFEYNNICKNINNPKSSYTAAPTAGTWEAGEKIYFRAPAANTDVGCICTTEGTFGTLSGITGSGTTGTPTLTVSSASDMIIGDYITVTGAGTHRIQNISGTTITLWTNLTATVSGATVQYSNPVFKNFGPIDA